MNDRVLSLGSGGKGNRKAKQTGAQSSSDQCEYCSDSHKPSVNCPAKWEHCKLNGVCIWCGASFKDGECSANCEKPGKKNSGAGKRLERRQGSGKDAGGRTTGSKGKKVSVAAQECQSNALRPADCLRCKYIGEQGKECAGCGAKSGLDHCLAHCAVFTMGSVSERTALVKKAKACVVCLFPGHASDECRNHCRSTQGCHYWTWYNAKADQNRRRKQPFECELKSDDHCGAWGSYCYRRHHDHAISGTGDPNSCA